MQIIQKTIIICRNISLVIAIWPDTLIAYIALNPIFTFLRQFHPRDLANFAGKYHHLLLHRCSHHLLLSSSLLALWVIAIDLAAALPDIFLNWQPYLMVSSFLSLPPQIFRSYFVVTILWVSRSLRHLRFLGKLFSGVSSTFFTING